MSLTFSKSLAEHLDQVIVGPPVYDSRGKLQNMVVYPILPLGLGADPPDMITLSEALNMGLRLTDTGVVSRVHADNPLPTSILAGESEILIGSTQARSLQFSCLLGPQRKAALPVNCVEEGRPTEYQTEFNRADACPWPLRAYKMEQLARFGEPPQYWVWDQIKNYLSQTATCSATHNVHAVIDNISHQMQSLGGIFPLQVGQVGAICTVGQGLIVELFGDPEIFEDRYDQVLRSAMAEAIANPSDQIVHPGRVSHFLPQIVEICQQSKVLDARSLKDSGRALAFSGMGISGQALISEGHLVHLAAHQKCIGQIRPLADLVPVMDSARSDWELNRPTSLDSLGKTYVRRRRRYNAFKSKLQEYRPSEQKETPDQIQSSKESESAPAPIPLNPALHKFFLRLFSRH